MLERAAIPTTSLRKTPRSNSRAATPSSTGTATRGTPGMAATTAATMHPINVHVATHLRAAGWRSARIATHPTKSAPVTPTVQSNNQKLNQCKGMTGQSHALVFGRRASFNSFSNSAISSPDSRRTESALASS